MKGSSTSAGPARPNARCNGRRRSTLKLPFGTLKWWIGSAHFLTKTLEEVRTEMSCDLLAYKIKKLIQMFGVSPLADAIKI